MWRARCPAAAYGLTQGHHKWCFFKFADTPLVPAAGGSHIYYQGLWQQFEELRTM